VNVDWRNLLAVAMGGAFGSSARYLLGIASLHRFGPGFPWGTLGINLLGSLLIGFVGELALGRAFGMTASVRLFLMVGVLGGFTTFSAFSLEAVGLIVNRSPLVALSYAGGSVLAGLVLCYLGILAGRFLIHL